MIYYRILTVFLIGLVNYNNNVGCQGQKIAPGVPPQQYQQVPQHVGQQQHHQHQQQQQYQQQQYQQMPPQQVHQQPHHQQQQYQQVPVQQQQVPVQQHHPGGHAHDHSSGQFLNVNVEHEKEHIQEHMSVPIDTSKMSEQELQFHYFKMHDADDNNKLDGCELIKSLIHWHEQGKKTQTAEEKIFVDNELEDLIDPILNMDDNNRDGFIDYLEFIQAQQKASANNNNAQN